MKTAILTAIRFLAVALVYFVDFVVVSGALLSTTQPQPAPVEASKTLVALLTVSLISAAVWTYVVRRSRWSGWKLILCVFFVFYGNMPCRRSRLRTSSRVCRKACCRASFSPVSSWRQSSPHSPC